MKKFTAIILGAALMLSALSGCAQTGAPQISDKPSDKPEESAEKLSVVTTIFAPYDFVREVAGEAAEVTMLLPPASESHSFEPTPKDIITIQNCDVFIYAGGDSDAWVDGVLESLDTSNIKIITLMDCVATVEEEIVEGMEDDHGHSHGEEDFDPANVKDRPMSDFAGAWISAIPLIQDGSLNEYIEHTAEENEITAEQRRSDLLTGWASDYDSLKIDADTLEFNGTHARYSYQGYEIVESDHGSSVWYQYQIEGQVEGLPSFLIFNDHGYGSEHEDEHDDEHQEEGHEEIAHLHIKYGNDGFAALLSEKEWAPFYFDSTYSNAEIGAFMGEHESDEARELDEHVWTSPKNAKLIVQKISDTLSAVDADNAAKYQENTAAYLGKLDELDGAFQAVVDAAAHKTLVFGDRFPFRYFADAYGLSYFAAFPGCSTETEASAATVAFLIDKVSDEKIPAVLHVELSNQKMANTIGEATGAKVLLLHACHNVSKAEFESGVSYLDLMQQNVENLKEALG